MTRLHHLEFGRRVSGGDRAGLKPQNATHLLQAGCATQRNTRNAQHKKGVTGMPKKHRDFPEHLNLRLTTQQRAWLNDIADLHGVKPSDIVRGLISNAQVEQAVSTLDRHLGSAQGVTDAQHI